MTLTPLGDRILIAPDAVADRTESGLHLVEGWKPEVSGTVVGVPSHIAVDCPDCGHRFWRQPQVAVGETVIFSWEAGLEVSVDGVRHLLIKESDLSAVLEEGAA